MDTEKLAVVESCVEDSVLTSPCTEDDQRNLFRQQLSLLLDRPEPQIFECPCCQSRRRVARMDRLVARCMFSGLELVRHRCSACGGIFGPLPLMNCSPGELGQLYSTVYGFYHEGFSQAYQEKTFYLLNPSFKGKYLNYACGDWSTGIGHLRNLNWNVEGYEPYQSVDSPWIYSAHHQLQGQIYQGIFSHNYLEHVQDPYRFFCECRSLLASRGTMAHSSACYEYVYSESPFHLFFACAQSFVRLAARTGFQVNACFKSDLDVPGCQYVCCMYQST